MNINSPNVVLIERRLECFKVSSWFLKIMKRIEYRIAKKCHDFHHCCIKCDCTLMKQSFDSYDLILKVL